MNANEILRILSEQYGIRDAKELDKRIQEQQALDISIFYSKPKEEVAS